MQGLRFQCIPDYIDGFLLPLPTNSLPDYIKDELCMLAALQIKASDIQGLPPQYVEHSDICCRQLMYML